MGVTSLLLILSPNRPGFSRQLVAILNEIDVEYSSFNILADEEVRQGEGGARGRGVGKRGMSW